MHYDLAKTAGSRTAEFAGSTISKHPEPLDGRRVEPTHEQGPQRPELHEMVQSMAVEP
jgi:hypothetical protein